MVKLRDVLRAQGAPASTPAAPAASNPFVGSARIVGDFARGKDGHTAALLARVAFAIRHQAVPDAPDSTAGGATDPL